MRRELEANLAAVNDTLVTMTDSVRTAMADATTALLTADRGLAVAVTAPVRRRADRHRRGTDGRPRRTRGGDGPPVPPPPDRAGRSACAVRPDRPHGRRDGGQGRRGVLAAPNAEAAAELDRDDDTMDDLHQRLLSAILDRKPAVDVATGVQLVLLARYYERFADHTVNVGHRIVFRVNGLPVH